jgi:hypothetical protein
VHTCRLPRAPHADDAWQVPPLAWQQTSPPEQSVKELHSDVLPDGHAEPATQVAAPPPPSAAAKQHLLPVAQSVVAPQTWAVPGEQDVAHVLGAPAEPRQHC